MPVVSPSTRPWPSEKLRFMDGMEVTVRIHSREGAIQNMKEIASEL